MCAGHGPPESARLNLTLRPHDPLLALASLLPVFRALDDGAAPGSAQSNTVVGTGQHSCLFAPLEGQSGSTYLNARAPAIATRPPGTPYGALAMVVGILGIGLYWLPGVNLICPALAVILGAIGAQRAGKGSGASKLSAIMGMVLGALLFLIAVFVIDVVTSLGSVLNQAAEVTP